MPYNFPETENKTLKFWEDNDIFNKLRKKNQGKKRWSFLDGPITANNPMGVHHAWGRTYKDLFQRYKAMQGFDQRYQNGFDCQGLWVEVEVEKELGFKNKKDIEVYGIDKFVNKCKERVKKYSAIQTRQSIRLGQWMDWDNSYYTMSDENNYTIWHFLKTCWQKGYLYKGRDSVPWCPRCGTAISQHEILQEEYKEVVHKTVVLKLPSGENEYLLAWTTTPWSIPGTIGLMINSEFDYVKVRQEDGDYILAKERLSVLKGSHKIIEEFKGKELLKKNFVHPYKDFPALKGQKFPVIAGDEFVTLDIGTGIVTNNPGVGHEDYIAAKKADLPPVDSVDEAANFLDGYSKFTGRNAKDNQVTEDILKDLQDRGFVYDIFEYNHRYPICWRCKTELIFRSVNEWYISMEKIRGSLIRIIKKINWIPSFGYERELDWLKNMEDWLISKKRYWGLALPIFECEKCGNFEVIGSKEELKKRAVEGWDKFDGNSPHRPWVDNVKIKCSKCGQIISRIKDVGNPWLDAGIVSFSTTKYFEDKSYWRKWFPAELVCESFPGQFKNWFYSLLVMSVVLENKNPTETIFGYASVRDEKGEEMHKSKGNAIGLDEAAEKVGIDPIRWMYSKQNPAENLGFGYNVAEETKRKLMTLYNSYVFFSTYVKKEELSEKLISFKPKNILDKWIVSKVNHLIEKSESNLDKYDVARTVSSIEGFFINDLSLWYIRRSRKRFHEDNPERNDAVAVLYQVLMVLTKIMAPIMPFFAEEMYQGLKIEDMPESVHLCDWPKFNKKATDNDLEEKMDEVRLIVNLALAERITKGIKVKQPLASLKIKNIKSKIKGENGLLELVKDEVNVKDVIFDEKIIGEVELDTNITEDLKQEGLVRGIIRELQEMRKELGLKPSDKILISASGESELNNILEKNKSFILSQARAEDMSIGGLTKTEFDLSKEVVIEGEKLLLSIKK